MSIPLVDHQAKAVEAGWCMLKCVDELHKKLGISLSFRVGISCGPIIGL